LSAAEIGYLTESLKRYNIYNYFNPILGLSDVYAVGKEHIAKAWIAENKTNMSDSVMLGDTVHDALISDILGCKCLLIKGGHNSEEQLRRAGKPIVENISEAVDYIFKNF
jgi:phosphoglycolate phosphatase